MNSRLDRLDHLRAVAAFLVIAWHLSSAWGYPINENLRILSFIKQGHVGVSLFCVISGFILTTIYSEKKTSYATFIKNRFLRIAPLFIFIIFLAFFVSDWPAQDVILTTLTGLVRGGLPSFASAGWTVLIEMQFYLLFPFLLLFSKRYGPQYLLGLAITFLIVRAASWNALGTVQQLAYYSIFGRMDQFLVGMLAAIVTSQTRLKSILNAPRSVTAFFAVSTIATLAFFWWFEKKGGIYAFEGQPWPSRSAFWIFFPTIEAVLFAGIMIGYLHLPPTNKFSQLSRAFSYVGVISYSLYLDHILVFPTITRSIASLGLTPSTWIGGVGLCIVFALPILIAVASLTYFFIEKPFIELRSREVDSTASPSLVEPIGRGSKVSAGTRSISG